MALDTARVAKELVAAAILAPYGAAALSAFRYTTGASLRTTSQAVLPQQFLEEGISFVYPFFEVCVVILFETFV